MSADHMLKAELSLEMGADIASDRGLSDPFAVCTLVTNSGTAVCSSDFLASGFESPGSIWVSVIFSAEEGTMAGDIEIA